MATAETAPRWQEEIVEVQRIPAGPIGVDARSRVLRPHRRERIASLREITADEPHTKVSFESSGRSLPFRDNYVFQVVGARTRVTAGCEPATRGRGGRRVSRRDAAALSPLTDVREAQGSAAGPAPGAPQAVGP